MKFPKFFQNKDPIQKLTHEVDALQIKKLELDIQKLRVQLMGAQSRERKALKIIEASIGDPEPTEKKARAGYVSRIASFYRDIQEKKLLQLIAQTREMLDNPDSLTSFPAGSTRLELDWFLRGTSNAFKLLLDYGEQMNGEYQENIKGGNQ